MITGHQRIFTAGTKHHLSLLAMHYFELSMRYSFLFILLIASFCVKAQNSNTLTLKVTNSTGAPLAHATVELLRADSTLVKIVVTDTTGSGHFSQLTTGNYFARISRVGFASHQTAPFEVNGNTSLPAIQLTASSETLNTVTVTARKPFIEMQPDKTIVNLEASITNVGTTALEALEKLPGVTVDKDGNISLKGKSGVLILIDGKQTYMDAAQLSSMLGGMSAAQLSQVEIMDQPSARYDAAGNAGIINIKTKKEKQKGFNGSITTAYGQGFYPKNNNSLQLNYRSGRFNYFANYSLNRNESFTNVYALRRYYEADDKTVATQLEQPSRFHGQGYTHNLRVGTDYSVNSKTTLGINVNGMLLKRNSEGVNNAAWMDASGRPDSLISTQSTSGTNFKTGGANFNFRHQFSSSRELTADVDVLRYQLESHQYFENKLIFPQTYTEASRAAVPSVINILSAKADYSQQVNKVKVDAGWKSSHITTDNKAAHEFKDATEWKPDLGKSNHFLYEENIHAVYTNAQTEKGKWNLQGGLRFETTNYNAQQLGNRLRKDSSFSRSYNSLFPSLFASYHADSSHQFTFIAARRIDRPAFQNLNPFVFIINKYTYQQGNPFMLPQYTWNFEVNHQFKQMLTTGFSYSSTKDYISQVFPADTSGLIIYTNGNIGRLQQWGVDVGVQLSPLPFWSFNTNVVVNYKKLEGELWKQYNASITQYTISMAHQFKLPKGWSGELSGFYTSRSQVDLQEILDPAGQLSAGLGKNLLKNKVSLKLAVRDIFYTQWMKGMTYFEGADEYFKLTRDTRVATVSATWRFGKGARTTRRNTGSAADEIQRVGTGN